MDSGTGITKLAQVGVTMSFYGMELGSVTLKRIGFFVFQLNTQHAQLVVPGTMYDGTILV
jgi:hypothetical protein